MTVKAIVVGAGIGGLSAAVAMRQAGVAVTVLERASGVYEVGAGLGMAPNAVGALTSLGVAEPLAPFVSRPVITARRRWSDGTELFATSLDPAVDTYGYPFWFVHRGDLQRMLLDAAQDPQRPGPVVDVRLDARVVDVDADAGRLTLEGGEQMQADLVVAADGLRSVVRAALFGASEPTYTGHSGFRTQVRVADVTDPALRELVERRGFESWLGPGAHVVHSPFRSDSMVNVTACIETERLTGAVSSAPVSVEETLSHLEGWDPALRRLVSSGNGVHRYDIYVRPPMTEWSRGRVCLIGDAVHPMLPYLGQGAAQAIEDGEALGAALGRHGRDVAGAIAELEELRVGRANEVQALSARNATTFHLPDGPAQEERDRAIAAGATDSEVTRWLWKYQAPRETLAGRSMNDGREEEAHA